MTRCEVYDPATGHQCALSSTHPYMGLPHECIGLEDAGTLTPTHDAHRWVDPEA